MNTPLVICVMLLVSTGCASRSKDACDFRLDKEEWSLVPRESNAQIIPIESGASTWYLNAKGDYLICYNSVSDYVCGGTYETFDVNPGKGYIRDFIVCTSD